MGKRKLMLLTKREANLVKALRRADKEQDYDPENDVREWFLASAVTSFKNLDESVPGWTKRRYNNSIWYDNGGESFNDKYAEMNNQLRIRTMMIERYQRTVNELRAAGAVHGERTGQLSASELKELLAQAAD